MLSLKVTGMTCGGCVKSVEKALLRVDPAAQVHVDLTTGQVTVDGRIEEAEARGAIEAAGFDVEQTGLA